VRVWCDCVGYGMGWMGGWDETIIFIFDAILHALRMQTTAKLLGSPDPLYFQFSTKAHWC